MRESSWPVVKTGSRNQCGLALRHTHHTSSESSSHSAPYLQVLHLVNFLPTSEPEPSSSVGGRGRKLNSLIVFV